MADNRVEHWRRTRNLMIVRMAGVSEKEREKTDAALRQRVAGFRGQFSARKRQLAL